MRTITSQLCLLGMIASVCGCPSASEDPFESLTTGSDWTAADDGTETNGTDGTDPTGDGDGDPPGDGDGDTEPTGDGDGEPTGDGDPDPTGDGDPDPTGDGDPDPTGDGDGTDGCTQPDYSESDLSAKHNSGLYLSYGGPVGDVGECDTFLQDCPVGEKCVPYGSEGGNWDSNKCVPIMGDGAAGESCVSGGTFEANDDCDGSTVCWDLGPDLMGTCTPFCTGTPEAPQCPEGSSCLQTNQGSVAICIDGCDPLLQDCGAGDACFFAGDSFSCIFTTSNLGAGEACGFINDCAQGNACLTGELIPNCAGSACCGEFCDLDCGVDSCTLPGTSCMPFFEANGAPPGHADVGVCIIP